MSPPDSPKPRTLNELLGRAEVPPTPPTEAPPAGPPAPVAPAAANRPAGRAPGRGQTRGRPRPVPAADLPPAAAPPAAPAPVDPSPPSPVARARPRARGAERGAPIAIIDGSNVAHAGEGSGARLANILAMREKLASEGFQPVIVVDAALRHQIDDGERYERLVADGLVKQAPAGTDADYFILAFARELGATIVSNDQFRDGGSQFEAARKRVIRYMIVAGEVVLERRSGRRPREEGRRKR